MTAYIHIPGMQGDVETQGYEGWIELGSINHQVFRSPTLSGHNINSYFLGNPTVSEFLLGKCQDSASPLILAATLMGNRTIPTVEIHTCRLNNGMLEPRMIYKLHDVYFTGYWCDILQVDDITIMSDLFSIGFANFETHYFTNAYTAARALDLGPSSFYGFDQLDETILPSWLIEAGTGFIDSASLGVSQWVREQLGNGETNTDNSKAYLVGNIAGYAIPSAVAARLAKWVYVAFKKGKEYKIGENWRIAPFGNRTDHPQGKYPHYHRRGNVDEKGHGAEGQGISRHRPWEKKEEIDESFWDRF